MGAGSRYGTLMGLAVGDALGTTHEFRSDLRPPRFPALATGPLTNITGGGPFAMKPGQVTDDTAMACLLAEALHTKAGPIDGPVIDDGAAADLYVKWLDTKPPDVGNQTRTTLEHVRRGVAPAEAGRRVWLESDRRVAGNGSLMRTAPIGVYYAGRFPALWDASFQDSAVTHFDPRCQLACAVLNTAISDAATRKKPITLDKLEDQSLKALHRAGKHLLAKHPDEATAIKSAIKVLREDLTLAQSDDPLLYGPELHLTGHGQGFVRVAFRLAFWELFHVPSFEAGLTDVVNRGGDADTNGAIAGALLGAHFGVMAIPSRWRAAVLDAPPDARLGEMAEACHPGQMFRRQWYLCYTAPRESELQAVQFAECDTMPMPQARARLPLKTSYTKEELGRIVLGVLPEAMEDKWFIYTEDGVTHFHRSWTGIEVFRIRLTSTGDGAIVTEAWANRDANQFGSVDNEEDTATLCHLIDVLLLDRPSRWPGSGTEANPLAEWSVMGRSMLAHDAAGEKAGKLDAAIRAGARTPIRRKARKKPSDPGA